MNKNKILSVYKYLFMIAFLLSLTGASPAQGIEALVQKSIKESEKYKDELQGIIEEQKNTSDNRGEKKKFYERLRTLPNPSAGRVSNACRQHIGLSLDKSRTHFIIFVSSRLPRASLQALYQQAELIGGKLIFRGLIENSFQKTKKFFEESQINGEVDPQAFTDLTIQNVPAFVLREGEASDQVIGNISAYQALEIMARKGELKEEARLLLERKVR